MPRFIERTLIAIAFGAAFASVMVMGLQAWEKEEQIREAKIKQHVERMAK